MTALLYISIMIFVTYIVAMVIVTKKVPDSISDTFYDLGGGVTGSLFTWFCFLVSFTLLPYWIEVSEVKILPFIACAALGLVGAAPLFKSHQKMIHFISAAICFASAYVWIVISSPVRLTVASLVLLVAACFARKKMFWWEITAFTTIYVSLGYDILHSIAGLPTI